MTEYPNLTPSSEVIRPGVVGWFHVYCWVLCVVYFGFAALSLVFFLGDPVELETTRTIALLMGTIFLLLGLGLLAACSLPLILKPRPWVWTYDLVIICLGMTSACFLPACVVLLLFWLKPETKNYFSHCD